MTASSGTDKTKGRQLYDKEIYTQKAKAALTKLMEKEKPGKHTSLVGKNEILMTVRNDIQTVLDAGFTKTQIIDAFTNGDVFRILPKTLTELLNDKPRDSRKMVRKKLRNGSLTKKRIEPQAAERNPGHNEPLTNAKGIPSVAQSKPLDPGTVKTERRGGHPADGVPGLKCASG